ncbi:hypothetical protein [Sorangium sp. So ce341]|uniref:hypothetical protein n=1 Tax=Sorangium sp. So ce341 TaxID=3133302 RepID=UPI003F648043
MSTFTSASRFDEKRRFTGVFQQMGRVLLDRDWNEASRMQRADARRRTADLANGSSDDGFLITDDFLVDPVRSLAGFTGTPLDPSDVRYIPPVLTLDRREPESLPFVVRSRGHTALSRALPAPLDLAAVPETPAPETGAGATFAASALVLSVRFRVPTNEDEVLQIALTFTGPGGTVSLPLHEVVDDPEVKGADLQGADASKLPVRWTRLRVPAATLAPIGGKLTSWGFDGLPPRVDLWVSALRAAASDLDATDLVVRGGDGTLVGAGRIFVQGERVFLERDVRYRRQADWPLAPALPSLADGEHLFLYLDVWELPVTYLDDDFLEEPALDGLDTTTRERLVSQVKADKVAKGEQGELPSPVGPGALTTVFADGDARPLRYKPEKPDACRDRCLFTGSLATGKGYRGADNVHVRVELLTVNGRRAVAWSRDNASTVLPLVEDAPSGATVLRVASRDADKLLAGDLVVVEDSHTRLFAPGRAPVLRRVLSIDTATGTVELEAASATVGLDTDPLPVGGPLPVAFLRSRKAALRRYDGADWLVANEQYNLPDGIVFAFSGTPSDTRPGDFWSFTARVANADGDSHGRVEPLVDAPPHGPVHRTVPLARVEQTVAGRVFHDLRPRYLPLVEVRDRLIELGQAQPDKGPFVVVVGDGEHTHGDYDQDREEGITGDEAIQRALRAVEKRGGTVYIRAGSYTLERPVVLDGLSNVRILGDGPASVLTCVGAFGAFVIDACGASGPVGVELLALVDAPKLSAILGRASIDASEPSEPALAASDLAAPSAASSSLDAYADKLAGLGAGKGRVMQAIRTTLDRLRWLQKRNPGEALESNTEAQGLLEVLRRLPHGVVTVADSRGVSIERCALVSQEAAPLAAGVFLTGACDDVRVDACGVRAAAGVVASPLAMFFTDGLLARYPLAGLALRGLAITGCTLEATGAGVIGVRIADGALDRVLLRDNHVDAFAVGIEIDDRVRISEPGGPIVIAENHVTGARSVGILAAGDHLDLVDNEVRVASPAASAADAGLVHAGILVTGQHTRVRGSWITLRAVTRAPVLGLAAGIVVGDGLDDGDDPGRAVLDVEIADNRIEGSGASAPVAGVVLGGPQPIYDVRVRGNVLRDLGDAAVRLLGTTPAAGRLRIEDNRVEEVALVEEAATSSALADELALLAPDWAVPTGLSGPKSLLEALVGPTASPRVALLDAALRWTERAALRGAIVLAGADEAEVRGNRVHGVGLPAQSAGARPLTDVRRTAGVALAGGRDVVVEDNHVNLVRAPVTTPAGETEGITPHLPHAFAALQALDASIVGSRKGAADTHAAVAALHEMTLEYAFAREREEGGSAEASRRELGRRMYASLDAVTADLERIGELAPAAQVRRLAAALRSGQGEDVHTGVAVALAAALAHAAGRTASTSPATTAWSALEAAYAALIANRDEREEIRAILKTFPQLLDGVPPVMAGTITSAIESSDDDLTPVPRALTVLAWFRDETGRADADPGFEAVGYRRDVINSITRGLLERLSGLDTTTNRPAVLGQLRTDTRSLAKMLREAGSHLAFHVEADFARIDVPEGKAAAEDIKRLSNTLDRVWAAAEGKETGGDVDIAAESAVLRSRRRGQLALYLLVVDSTLEQLDALDALDDASEALVRPAVELFGTTLRALGALVEREGKLRKAAEAAVKLAAAAEEDPSAERPAAFRAIREHLDGMRAALVEDLRGRSVGEPAQPSAATGPRVAALGAALLSLDDVPSDAPSRKRAFDLLAAHVRRGLAEVAAPSSLRTSAEDALESLSGAWLGQGASEQVAHAAGLLAGAVEGLASEAASLVEDADARAVAALARTASFSLQTGSTEAERLAQSTGYIAARKAEVSPAVLALLSTKKDLPSLKFALRGSLEHIAMLPGIEKKLPELVPSFPLAPDPSDGIFAAGVTGRLSITQNRLASALVGASVLGPAAHIAAEKPAEPGPLSVEILRNEIRECGAGALDVVLPTAAAVVIAHNHVTACADLAATDTAAGHNPAPERASKAGQAVVRAVGSGDLFVVDNILHGNGHGHPRALLHELFLDFRGDVVVRGNVVRHTGGGEGGAGLLLVVEDVEPSLLARLARQPALDVDRPPAKPATTPPIFYLPWRPLAEVLAPEPLAPVAAPAYVTKAQSLSKASLIGHLLAKPAIPLIRWILPARRAVHVEGNRLGASGPALLVVGAGEAIVSATVVGNELRSARPTGAAYLRHTDATVFSSNHCECAGVVTVVVLRPDRAPVSVTGNVVLGSQPPRVSDRAIERQSAVADKLFGKAIFAPAAAQELLFTEKLLASVGVKARRARELRLIDEARRIDAEEATRTGAEGAVGDRAAAAPSLTEAEIMARAAERERLARALDASGARTLEGTLSALNFVADPTQLAGLLAQQAAAAPARKPQFKPIPQPASHSLVVLGGTNVATVGNATTAGTLVVDAADHTSLDR